MNRNEKWVQRMKKAVTLLLVVSLVLGSVPANVLAAGSAHLNAAIAAADENTQDAPAPSDTQETLPTPDTTAPEAPSEEESSQAEQPAEAPEAQAAEEALKAAEAPQDKEAEPLPEGPEIMAVENPLKVVEAPETQDAEIGERVVLSANIEAQDPAGVTYQWQAKNGGDAGTEVQSTDEALEQKKASLEAAEAIDLEGITGDESPEAAEAVQSKARGIAEAKTRPIEPDNEGWSDIPGANSTQLAVDVAPETAGAPTSYRMVARTREAAIATPAAMIRTNADFEEGSGTERDPYIIATDQQLWNLHKYEGTASEGKYWRLEPSRESTSWSKRYLSLDNVPIGRQNAPFMGTLDGDGYSIKNPGYSMRYVPIPGYDQNGREVTIYGTGVFGYLEDATIVNVNTGYLSTPINTDDSNAPIISGTNVSVSVGGGIAAVGKDATIENCSTDGNLFFHNQSKDSEQLRWPNYSVTRYALGGGIVGCGTAGGYSARFTGVIRNCSTSALVSARGSFKPDASGYFGLYYNQFEGGVYPNTPLDAQYRPKLEHVYLAFFPDYQNHKNPDAINYSVEDRAARPGVINALNDYVDKNDKNGRFNYWHEYHHYPAINNRGLLDFKVSDYITTYDGSPQKATINCALREAQRGRDWDYVYKNDQGETVAEDSVKRPGTYDILFENKNNHYYTGRVESAPADSTANPRDARMIVNPMADQAAPVCDGITYTAEGSPYQPNTWTDQDVTVTFNVSDFTKGGNYDTLCDTTPYTVDQEGNEISGVQQVVARDAAGTEWPCTPDGAGNYSVTLRVDENQQLTTTLTASMTDHKGNTATAATEPIKISKSGVNIEVTAQKDNDEQPVPLSSGLTGPYTLFARQRIRFEVTAAMADNSLYVNRIEYKFVPNGAEEASVDWTATGFEDQQNPHSVSMALENNFDGALYVRAASANGKEAATAYKVMLEAHEPAIQNLEYIGYKGQTDSGSGINDIAAAGYTKDAVYYKVDLNINYEDPQNEKSGIVKAEIFRADNNALLGQKDITPAADGRGQEQGTMTLTCDEPGSYAVKIVLTDRAGNTYTRTTDTLNIERAVPALDVEWKAPVSPEDGEKYGFDKWCYENPTVTLKLTNNTDTDNANDLANSVDYYSRRVKKGEDINNAVWEKINQAPLSPTESLDVVISDDGEWQYAFKAVSAANICGAPVEKNIRIDTKSLDGVAVTPEDTKTADASDIQTTPNARGWFTGADRSLNIGLSLANNGLTKITGHYKITRKASDEATETTTVAEAALSTAVGQEPQTVKIPCAQDGVYEVTVHSTTESGRVNTAQTYTFRVDRAKPELSKSWFIMSDTEKKDLPSWTADTSPRYYWYANKQGQLEINAKDNASGVDKIEYQICNDINQAAPAADGAWQVYDPDNKPVFTPEFKGNVFIRVTDKAGLVTDSGENSHSASFCLDDQKPTVEITSDKDLSQWQTSIRSSVKIKDAGSGIKKVSLKVDGGDIAITMENIDDKTPAQWKAMGIEDLKAVKDDVSGVCSEISFTYVVTKASENRKTHKKLKLTAEDNSGSTTDAIEKTYKIDTTEPVVSVEYTDARNPAKWYNLSPGFTLKNTMQAQNDTDDGDTHTLSGVRYYYKTWKTGENEPTDWIPINDTPTDKAVSYTYPHEGDASVRFKGVSESGLEAVSEIKTAKVDRTNPKTPEIAVRNAAGGAEPDGENGWYNKAWPAIRIPTAVTSPGTAPESIYYKLYTGNNSSTAQTATMGQSILNSSFNQDSTSPGTGEGQSPGIFTDKNNQKDQLATAVTPEPADPVVNAEGVRESEPLPYEDPCLSITSEDDFVSIGSVDFRPLNERYKLMNDITVNLETFGGIPDYFSGTFDGNGHTITFNRSGTPPVFRNTTETARIMNLNIVAGQLVSGNNMGQLTHCTVDSAKKPLVGSENSGTIANCSLGGTFMHIKDNTFVDFNMGGIVPYNTGTIRDCKVTINITSERQNLGGIAGWSTGTIQNCEYSGQLTAIPTIISGSVGVSVGGIVGTASGSVIKCKTTTSKQDPAVNADSARLECAGGIVGKYTGNALSDCENTINVNAPASKYAGGIAGALMNAASISSCKNTGEIQGPTAGGIVGYVVGGSVRNAVNTGDISGGNGTNAGGLVGNNNGGAVSDSKTTGTVDRATYIGGAVGTNSGSMVNCYANPGAITPTAKTGGFVGRHTAGSINTCATTANSFAGTNYSYAKAPAITADGVYTLEAWAKDAATDINDKNKNTSGKAKQTIMVDTHGPSPFTAQVETNTFTQLLNSLTFGLFFDKTTDVVLEAKDDVSGIDSITYSLYATDSTSANPGAGGGTLVETKRVSGKEKAVFSVTPNFQGYVYAEAKDKAGNTTKLSTDGFTINSNLPRVKATATKGSQPYDGDWSKEDVSVKLTFDKTAAGGGTVSGNFVKYEYSIDNGKSWSDIANGDNSGYFTATAVSSETQTLTFNKATSQSFMFRAVISGRTDTKDRSETAAVSIKLDKQAPTVQELDFGTAASTSTTEDGYKIYSQQPTLTLTAADDTETGLIDGTAGGSIASGLQSQTYKLNTGGADKPYTSPLAMEDGKYEFEFTATDRAGSSTTKTDRFIVDTMTPKAPKTEARANGADYDGSWIDKDVTITAATADTTVPASGYAGTTGIKYQVYKDGAPQGNWQDYTNAGVRLEAADDGSEDGAYTVRFKVVTNAGHESTESTVGVNIQKAAPALTVAVNGKASTGADTQPAWTNQPVTLEVSTNGEKLSAKKNNGSYTDCTNTHDTKTVTEDGITTWQFKAENKAKTAKESDVYKIALDQKAPDMPEITISEAGTEKTLDSNAWYDDTVRSTLKIKDKTSETDSDYSPRTLWYRVYKNDAASAPGYSSAAGAESSIGANITDSGTWIIEAYTQDEAGNASAVNKQIFNYTKDDNAPELEISFDNTVVKTLAENGGTPVYAGSVNAAITAKDDKVGIKENSLKFKLVPDAGTKLRYGEMTRYTGPVEIENFKGAIEAEVENNAGQKKTVSARICADSEKPSVSITEAGNKPQKKWAKESFSLQVNGGENTVSGFEKYQYYDAGGNTWVDFTEADRINPGIDHLWKNVKYDVTDNGKTLVKFRSVNNAGIASDEAAYEVWKDDTEAKIDIEVDSDLVDGVKWSKGVVFTPKLTSAAPPSGVDYYYRAGDADTWKKMAGKSLTIKQTTPEAGQAYDFKAVSGTGNTSDIVSETAHIDGEKPKTPLLAKSLETPDGQNGWYITKPEIIISEAARETDSTATGLDIDDERRSAVKTEYQLTAQSTIAALNQFSQRSRAAADAPTGWIQGTSITPEGDGTYSIIARGRDAADNVSDVTAKENIKVDTQSPTIETNDIQVSSLTGGSLGLLGGLLFNDTVEVTVTAKDTGSGVHQITYALGDGTAKTLTADGNGRVSFRLSPVQGTPLNTSLKLTATDLAGRESAPVTIDNLLLEADKPEVSITPAAAPNDKGWYKGVLPYTVTARDSDAGLETVRAAMDQNGSETVVANDTVDAADSKNTKQYNSTITQSGSAQRVTVEAKDRAGNTQTVEKTFKVETAAPALGVSFTLMDGADTAYNSAATSYDICAALSYDEPASGVEDLQVSTDHGSTWASVSDALGKKHVINTETNADYQFRLVTNAGNVSAATAAQNVVINRKMPGAPAIEVKDQNGNILNETWSNQDQTATVLVPSCDDAGVRQATEYEYQTYKDSTADTSRTGTIAPSESGQSVALADFTEEGEYIVSAWAQQKDSGLQDTENICEKKVMVDKTPPDASQTKAAFFMDNGALKLTVLVSDALSGGGRVDYTMTQNGVESPLQTMVCDDYSQAVLDVSALGAGDRITIKKVYDKAGNSAVQTGMPDLTIPDNIDLTKVTVQITPGETAIEDWYYNQPLSASARVCVVGGSKPEDIKDASGTVLKTYPDANSITKVDITHPDNRMDTLDYTQAGNSGQTETDVPIMGITGEGEGLVLKVTAYDAWDNSATGLWTFKNDVTPPDKPGLKLTTSEGELGSDGRTDKDVTLTVEPDYTNENQTDPNKKKTSPLSSWQYSLDGGATWSEQYSISSEASSLSRVIASEGGLDTDSLVVRVSDLVGNTSVNSEPKSVHVTDMTAPINLSITEADGTSPVDSAWDNRKADRVLKVHAADPAEGVISLGLKEWNYSLDGGSTWQTANIPWDDAGGNTITIAGDGIYAVTFKVWDKAGNVSQLDREVEIKKDQTVPVVQENNIQFEQKEGADNWIKAAIHWLSFGNFFNDTIRVTVPVEDTMSGNHSLTYSIGDTATEMAVKDGKAVFTLPVNGVKDQTLAVWAKDIAGNVSETLPVKGGGETAQWTTENSGPIIGDAVTSVTANAAGWYTQDIPVSVRIEDMDSGLAAVSWQLNDEPEQTVMPSEHERKDSENIEINITEDGVNTLTVKAADNAGNTAERSYSFKLDHGQELAAYITETTGEPVDPECWRGEKTVRLKANMAVGESDIAAWEYTLDGGQTWTAPEAWGDENILEIEEDGVYSQLQTEKAAGQQNLIAVRVTDMAGNQKESPYESIKKDSEAPAFAAVQMDEANGNVHENVHWYKDRKPSVRLVPELESAEKAPVIHTYALNGEPVVFDSETELREWLKEGENILRVYAKDAAGNEAKEGNQNYIEKVFYIDTEAPEIGEASFKDIGNKPIEKLIHWLSFGNFYNEAVQVTVPVTDAASGCEALTYSIGGQSAQAPVKDGKASFEIPMDTDAKVTCHAEDMAGNETGLFAIGKESSQWVLTRKIEVPNLWVNGEAASGGWYNQPVSYELLVSCPEAGIHSIKQTMDNGEPVMLGEAVFAEGLVPEYRVTGELSEDGVHQMLHVITDNAGNKTQRGDFIKIDQTAPKGLAITGAPENGEALEPQTLTVLANDSIEGIETSGLKAWSYTLDGGKTWTEPQLWNQKGENTITVEDARAYDISFKVWDHAGNVSELSEMERVRFTITSDKPSADGNSSTDGNLLTKVTTVINPVTGLYFTAGQLLGLAGCLMAIAAAFMVSLIWYRKNRRQ